VSQSIIENDRFSLSLSLSHTHTHTAFVLDLNRKTTQHPIQVSSASVNPSRLQIPSLTMASPPSLDILLFQQMICVVIFHDTLRILELEIYETFTTKLITGYLKA
jgi:hypothetical protein